MGGRKKMFRADGTFEPHKPHSPATRRKIGRSVKRAAKRKAGKSLPTEEQQLLQRIIELSKQVDDVIKVRRTAIESLRALKTSNDSTREGSPQPVSLDTVA
jgi:hypothetical protein